jgi:hypothetical protein
VSATFSPCRLYRYTLTREWDESLPTVVFCGLNPSTADETLDDPTIRREVGFAKDWGFGRLVKVNAYGYRSTDPKGLWTVDDPRGEDNFMWIRHWATKPGVTFVAAWGNNIRDRDAFELRRLLRGNGVTVHALKLTKTGNPSHPLYLPKTLKPFAWPQ